MTDQRLSSNEFADACRTEFRYLVTDFGFQEAPDHPEFQMKFVRDDLEIVIEGINWGAAVIVALCDKKGRKIGVGSLNPQYDWIKRPGMESSQRSSGQLEDIALNAQFLRRYGTELLKGDFSAFEQAINRFETIY